jgi:hypothetical protein
MGDAEALRRRPLFRDESVSDINDFYIDDVDLIFSTIKSVCATVSMESNEYSNITMENIDDIKDIELTEFIISGSNPQIQLRIGPDDWVRLTTVRNEERLDPLFDQLKVILNRKKRPTYRLLRIPTNIAVLIAAMVLLVLVPSIFDVPESLSSPWGFLAGAMIFLWIGFIKPVFFGPFVVVHPVWKRGAPIRSRIDWRNRLVDVAIGVVLSFIAYLLYGKD